MKIIIAHSKKWGNQKIMVDDDDFLTLNKVRWCIRRSKNGRIYARRNDYKGGYANYIDMHRLIMKFPKNGIDHIDGDTLNNQKNNLREATQSQNAKNQLLSTLSTTGYKGVSLDKRRGTYTCFITCNYKHIYGGSFSDPKEAALKYNELAIKYHGEFAKLNPISS